MNAWLRNAVLFAAGLILAVILAASTRSTEPAYAGCGSDVAWWIESELFGRRTMDMKTGRTTWSQEFSDGSSQRSNNGQESTHLQTHQTNADGSSTESNEFTYTDSLGKGCNSDGMPRKASTRSDEETDPEGNRKEHAQQLIIENGKCMLSVRDREWDRAGNLIKDTGWVTTEVSCGLYSMEVVMKGRVSDGGSEMTYGPNALLIPLENKGEDTHKGRHEGEFNVTLYGECSGVGTYPVSFDITGIEDRLDEVIAFTVETSLGAAIAGSCHGASGSVGMPAVKGIPLTFTLPAEEGASKVYPMSMGGAGELTLTFTLRRNPQ